MPSDVKTAQVEREQWGLSSVHVKLFLINSNDDHTQTGRHKQLKTDTATLLSLFLSCCNVVFLPTQLSIFITSRLIFPLPIFFRLYWRKWKETFAQDRSASARLLEHNGFYVCNSHRCELSVLGWAVDCSPKRRLSFNIPVHEYCMARREEARVLEKWFDREGLVT